MGGVYIKCLTNLSSDFRANRCSYTKIPADTFGYVINEDVIAELSDAALGAMSADQVGAFTSTAVNAITADILENIDPAAMAQFESFSQIDYSHLSVLSVEQFEALPDVAFNSFGEYHIGNLDSSLMSSFTPEKIAHCNHKLFKVLLLKILRTFLMMYLVHSPGKISNILPWGC